MTKRYFGRVISCTGFESAWLGASVNSFIREYCFNSLARSKIQKEKNPRSEQKETFAYVFIQFQFIQLLLIKFTCCFRPLQIRTIYCLLPYCEWKLWTDLALHITTTVVVCPVPLFPSSCAMSTPSWEKDAIPGNIEDHDESP